MGQGAEFSGRVTKINPARYSLMQVDERLYLRENDLVLLVQSTG